MLTEYMLRMLGRPVFSQLSISLLPVESCEYLWMEIRPGPRFGLPLDLALQRVAEIAASEELRKAWIGSWIRTLPDTAILNMG